MSKESESVFGCVGIILVTLLFLVLSSVLNGYVLTIMWGWFIVPVFELPALSLPYAIGFSMVVSYLTYQSDAGKEKK